MGSSLPFLRLLSVLRIRKTVKVKEEQKEDITLKKGYVYVLKKKDRWQAIELAHKIGASTESGLIVTSSPEAIPAEYNLERFQVLGCDSGNLVEVVTMMENFFIGTPGCLVILDGFDVIASGVQSGDATSIVSRLCNMAMISGSTLVVSLDGSVEERLENIKKAVTTSCLEAMIDAFSNPTRRRILEYLKTNDTASFTALMGALGFGHIPPKLSFHLNTLKNSNIVAQDENKAYLLTDYGKTLMEFSDGFENMVIENCVNLEKCFGD